MRPGGARRASTAQRTLRPGLPLDRMQGLSRHRRAGVAAERRVERIGPVGTEKAISLIAIYAHDIPHVFRRDTLEEAEAARPATLAGREESQVPFGDLRVGLCPARRAGAAVRPRARWPR